jgi:hypothetical protein
MKYGLIRTKNGDILYKAHKGLIILISQKPITSEQQKEYRALIQKGYGRICS